MTLIDRRATRQFWTGLAMAGSLVAAVSGQAQTTQTAPKIPQPFPLAGQATPSQPAAAPAAAAAITQTPPPAPRDPQTPATSDPGAPSIAVLGVTPYPGSRFIGTFDAGKGQRYFLFGSDRPYTVVVDYFRTVLGGNGGRELFKAPAMRQFDLPGKFQEETMAYPPSVVVKDYTWNNSEGYLFIDGTKETRFRTVIQIVPATIR